MNHPVKQVYLKSGNCLIYSILFKMKNPRARITITWNKKRRRPSFIPVLDGFKYVYKPVVKNDRTKFIFEGQVFKIKSS